MIEKNRIEVLDWLRGLAALSVALYHFTGGADGWVKVSGARGYLGLTVFFVISGLVIPYAMWRGRYRGLADAPTFILKRLTRLEPPYFAAIAITLVLGYLSARAPGFHGAPFHVGALALLLHVGYLNGIFGQPWLSPVFWTLALEFQFYLSMLFLYGGLSSKKRVWRMAIFVVMVAAALLTVPTEALVPRYLGLFALGAAGFQYRVGLIGKGEFALLALAFTLLNIHLLGGANATAAVLAAIAAAFANPPRVKVLAFFGAISYSLYLLHVPIGGRVINLASRLPRTMPIELGAVVTAMAVSLIAAWLLYRLVERPSQKWSASFNYRGNDEVKAAPIRVDASA
jgi:peptidoglycan/LPS O-acetylase OafA/YrhL